jgi:20S proteasome alpha/beta subunit
MTTIVCNKTEMACDLQFTLYGQMKTKGKTKIFQIDPHPVHYDAEPFLVGFAGAASEIIDVVDFYQNPEVYGKMPRTRNLSGLVLTKSGRIFQFDTPDKWIAVDEKYAAIGTGSLTAMGALIAGATPKQAVAAASKVDPMTGMGIKVFKL